MMRELWLLMSKSGRSRRFKLYLFLTWFDVVLMALPPLAAAEFIRLAYLQGGWPAEGIYCLGVGLAAPVLRFPVQWKARMLGVDSVFATITTFRKQLTRCVLDTSLWQLRRWSESQLLDHLGGDIKQIQEGIFIVLVRLQVNLLLSVILLLYVGYFRPEVLLGFLVTLTLCALLGYRLIATLEVRVNTLSSCNAAVRGVLTEMMNGIRTLRLFQATRTPTLELSAKLESQQQAQHSATPAFAVRDQIFHALLELSLVVGLLTTWGLQADANLLPAFLVLPLAYHNLYCTWQEWGLLKWTKQAWKRVSHLAALESQMQGDAPLPPGPQALALDAVSFTYPGRVGLDEVKARFVSGTHNIIVGRNGAGKSTLLMILARLYDPQKGRLLLGDTDAKTLPLALWRSQIAVVMQDTALFPATLRDNLLLGNVVASDEALLDVLRLTCCDFVNDWTDGLDTLMGAGGITPSGGERQRIAIARALLGKAPIVLLDEVTSSLDSDSAWRVQSAISALTRERTVIQVTHALRQAVHADQVLVLDEGRIVECGKHADLLSAGGIYTTLWTAYQSSQDWRIMASLKGAT